MLLCTLFARPIFDPLTRTLTCLPVQSFSGARPAGPEPEIMKKSVLSFFLSAFLVCSVINATATEPPVVKIPVAKQFSRLHVSDNISIVLVNEPLTEISLSGTGAGLQRARAAVKNGCLYVWMTGSADGGAITVEVPASLLRQVWVEGDSNIRSNETLKNPGLEVTVNGACRIDLRSSGKITVKETTDYEFRTSGR